MHVGSQPDDRLPRAGAAHLPLLTRVQYWLAAMVLLRLGRPRGLNLHHPEQGG